MHPLLLPSDLPYQLPRFGDFTDDDFAPALDEGMAAQLAAIAAITARSRAGDVRQHPRAARAERRGAVPGAADLLQQGQRRHQRADRRAARVVRPASWRRTPTPSRSTPTSTQRLLAVHEQRDSLDPEAALPGRALPHRVDPRRRGARRGREGAAAQAQRADLHAGDRVREHPAGRHQRPRGRHRRRGRPRRADAGEISAAAQRPRRSRGLDGKWLLTLVLPDRAPAPGGAHRPRRPAPAVGGAAGAGEPRRRPRQPRRSRSRSLRLRAERAALLGFASHAAAVTEDKTAGTPGGGRARCSRRLAAAGGAERAAGAGGDLERQAGFPVEAHDWPFYAEQVRAAEYDVDMAALRPWFEAERVLQDGVFFAANAALRRHLRRAHRPRRLPPRRPDLRGARRGRHRRSGSTCSTSTPATRSAAAPG